MITVTDAVTKNTVFLNADHVVAVFEIPEGDHKGKTGVNLVNGSIVCEDEMMLIINQVRAGV